MYVIRKPGFNYTDAMWGFNLGQCPEFIQLRPKTSALKYKTEKVVGDLLL